MLLPLVRPSLVFRFLVFDNKVCGQPCSKLIAPPDNMDTLGELPVNIGIVSSNLVIYFRYTYWTSV